MYFLKHISADGRVVNITADVAAASQREDREGEGVSHRVDKSIRDEPQKSLERKNNRTESLSNHSEAWVLVVLHPRTASQKDKINAFGINSCAKTILTTIRQRKIESAPWLSSGSVGEWRRHPLCTPQRGHQETIDAAH
jgi:hypothetical protein